VDFSGAVGTPILAPAAATVALAGDLYFTGQTVVLDHGQGLFSILAHLSEIAVVEGARIEGGSVVGALGATGRVTGPHLHWGVRLHGARVDPLSILKVLGGG
jgi:murein DD-endopeptidase MepM/ murein hydrolase activator NlpD